MRKSDGSHLPDVFGMKIVNDNSTVKDFFENNRVFRGD